MDRERLSVYINSLDAGYSPLLRRLAQEVAAEDVPIVRKETASFLKTLAAIKRPSRILEVGTAVGYSALLLAENLPAGSRITTIERDAGRLARARENFRLAGREGQITLLAGDAAEILPELSGPFDLIFMDPPYEQKWERRAAEILVDTKLMNEDTLIVIEASLGTDFSWTEPLGLEIAKEKKYKTNKHVWVRKGEG